MENLIQQVITELLKNYNTIEIYKQDNGDLKIRYFTGGSHGNWRTKLLKQKITYVEEDEDELPF